MGLLDIYASDPHGTGLLGLKKGPQLYDEFNRPVDDNGNRIAELRSNDQPSIWDSLYNIATSPARVATSAVTEPVNALSRMFSTPASDPYPGDLNQDSLTALLSMYGGNALAPARGELAGMRALSDTGKPSVLGSALAGARIHPDSPELLTRSAFHEAVRRGKVGPNPTDNPTFARIDRAYVPKDRPGMLGHIDNGLRYGYATDDIAKYVAHSHNLRNNQTYREAFLAAHNDNILRRWGPNWKQRLQDAVESGDIPQDMAQKQAEMLSRVDWEGPPLLEPELTPALVDDAYENMNGSPLTPWMGKPAILSDTGRPSLMGSAIAGLEGRPQLPMDQASRLVRAKELGFDTGNPLYHGTAESFDSFRPSVAGSLGEGVYLTPDKSHAGHFGDNIHETYVRGKIANISDAPSDVVERPWYRDFLGREGTPASRAADWARQSGYDGLSQPGYQTVVFDPSNIRSTEAAFDPANLKKNGLLLSDTGRPSPLGGSSQPQDPNASIMDILKKYGVLDSIFGQ